MRLRPRPSRDIRGPGLRRLVLEQRRAQPVPVLRFRHRHAAGVPHRVRSRAGTRSFRTTCTTSCPPAHSLFPACLVDDRGWYGDSSAQLSLTRDLAVTVKATFMATTRCPFGSTTPDPRHGLFPVTQASGTRAFHECGPAVGDHAGILALRGLDPRVRRPPVLHPDRRAHRRARRPGPERHASAGASR